MGYIERDGESKGLVVIMDKHSGRIVDAYEIEGEGDTHIWSCTVTPRGLVLVGSTEGLSVSVRRASVSARRMLIGLKPLNFKADRRSYEVSDYSVVLRDLTEEARKPPKGCNALVVVAEGIPSITSTPMYYVKVVSDRGLIEGGNDWYAEGDEAVLRVSKCEVEEGAVYVPLGAKTRLVLRG